MSSFSDYLENAILERTLRGGTLNAPSTVYVALFTADPTDAAVAANEVQGSAWPAYARQDAAQGAGIATGWTAPANGVSSNARTITFPANNGVGNVAVTHVALFDALTNGNMLYHRALTSSKTLAPGDVLSFAIGALTVTLT